MCNPTCLECLRRRIADLERELEQAREEAEWLRDEEGKRNAELTQLRLRTAEIASL